ncbi:hypothetical protein BGZ95_009406 [Linnemannia exigua]|uniref:Uncharacterized protein n=1 Tax=Linnemannia exigua TaxID=604196 RepID=A0AAD4H6S0_9FUNG|nr:hypothetical protein BGZ95_009406 [Linnemannia exigua]
MSLKGQHVETQAPTTSEYLQYQAIFGAHKLVKLYKIRYEPIGAHTLDSFTAFPSIYYHGTGHCGCVITRGHESDSNKIKAREWCGNAGCATQGILNHGHLMTCSPRGYAYEKSGMQTLFSVFLVKAQHTSYKAHDFYFVRADMDNLPCYLAVLRFP